MSVYLSRPLSNIFLPVSHQSAFYREEVRSEAIRIEPDRVHLFHAREIQRPQLRSGHSQRNVRQRGKRGQTHAQETKSREGNGEEDGEGGKREKSSS